MQHSNPVEIGLYLVCFVQNLITPTNSLKKIFLRKPIAWGITYVILWKVWWRLLHCENEMLKDFGNKQPWGHEKTEVFLVVLGVGLLIYSMCVSSSLLLSICVCSPCPAAVFWRSQVGHGHTGVSLQHTRNETKIPYVLYFYPYIPVYGQWQLNFIPACFGGKSGFAFSVLIHSYSYLCGV